MGKTDKYDKKVRTWRRWVFWILFILFILCFRTEISILLKASFQYFMSFLQSGIFGFLNKKIRNDAYMNAFGNNEVAYAAKIFWKSVQIYVLVLLIALLNIAQLSLPVRTWMERLLAYKRIILFMLDQHGPAIFVSEGKIVASQMELKKTRPGVALIDLSSAIVLEQQEGKRRRYKSKKYRQNLNTKSSILLKKLRQLLELGQERNRVFGSGVVFTRKGEKIHSPLDLRKQVRSKGDMESYTRDRVKFKNPVFVVFDLSGEPDVITVAYIGGDKKENLYWVEVDEENDTIQIKSPLRLDADDAEEIHQFVQYGTLPPKIKYPFDNAPPSESVAKSPFHFHRERVFEAAFSTAHTDGKTTLWDELPLDITLDIFQKEMESYYFDDLYPMNNPIKYSLGDVKSRFGRKVKLQGKLFYRVLGKRVEKTHKNNKLNSTPFQNKNIEKTLKKTLLYFSSTNELRSSKILRDRGIRIIAAGFPELRVAEEELKEKFMDVWIARWKKNTDIVTAAYTLEAEREIANKRAETQSELTYTQSQQFKNTKHIKEALALRTYQALSGIATQEAHSRETLVMLQNLHRWLLSNRKDFEKKSSAQKQSAHWVGEKPSSSKSKNQHQEK